MNMFREIPRNNMFSYLQTVQELVPIEILQRGQKLYLNKGVLSNNDMVLDFWRVYLIRGTSRTDEFRVTIPLLHLALNQKKWPQAPKALEETTTCECPYYEEYGVCKHIVCVCAAIDDEFNFQNLKKGQESSTNNQIVGDVFGQILEAQTQKEENQWLKNFEIVIVNPSWHDKSRWLSQMTTQIRTSPENYLEFWILLKKTAEDYSKVFEKERSCLNLAVETLIFDGEMWWKFWQDLIADSDFQNAKYFWLRIIQWQSDININRIFKELMTFARQKYSDAQKLQILELTTTQNKLSPKSQLKIAMDFQILSWLKDNLDKIDPSNLLDIVELFPDEAEKIELNIYNQLLEWIDLLPSGEGEEVLEVMLKWKKVLGNSDLLQDLGKYIGTNLKRRKNFVREVNKIVES